MAYSKTTWQDLPNQTTPITASRLNNMENGIENNDKRLNGTTPMGNIVVDSIRSKNMLDLHDFTTQTINGITFTDNGNGTITINGTATQDFGVNFVQFKINAGNYYLSINETATLPSTFYLYDHDSGTGFGNGAITLSQNYTHMGFDTYILNGAVFDNITISPQLETGSSATSFVPYQGLSINELVDKNVDIGTINANGYGLAGDFGLTHIFRELLGSSIGAENQSLDNFLDTGIYRCYPNTINKPDVDISGFATYGICVVIKSFDWYYQIYIGNWGDPCIASRRKTGNDQAWATWVAL